MSVCLDPARADDWSAGFTQPFRGQFTAGGWLAGADGHLQTPLGGSVGTTSSHRPTLEEIGLDDLETMPVFDLRLLHDAGHELHVNGLLVDRSGSDVLGEPLISNGVSFPEGTIVESELGLDTIRIGYRPHCWQLHHQNWTLTPEFGWGLSAFKYRLTSSTAAGFAERKYNVGFSYLGFLLERPIGQKWRCELEFVGSGGINHVSFVDAELRTAYALGGGESWTSWLVIGWRGLWFRRHDNQNEQQNDPNLRFGAFSENPAEGLTLGVRLGF